MVFAYNCILGILTQKYTMVSFEVEMLRMYHTAPSIESIIFSFRDSTIHLFPPSSSHHHHHRNKKTPPPQPIIIRRLREDGCACTVRHMPEDPIRLLIADSPRQLADKVLQFVQPELQSEECVMG